MSACWSRSTVAGLALPLSLGRGSESAALLCELPFELWTMPGTHAGLGDHFDELKVSTSQPSYGFGCVCV
ncbi:hypothetical protein ACWPKS_02610 [Coraliomargarita sp. W4R72]